MTSDPVRAIRIRCLLLAMAAVAFLLAVRQGLRHELILGSYSDLVGTCMIFAGTWCVALAIRTFGYAFLRDPIDPWYARRGAIIFLTASMFAANWLFISAAGVSFGGSHLLPPYSKRAFLWLIIALELVWIVVFDWPAAASEGAARPRRCLRWPRPSSLRSRRPPPEMPPSDTPAQPLKSWEYPPIFMDRSDSEESETDSYNREE